MAWQPDDVQRSVRRYLSQALPTVDPTKRWRLAFQSENVRDDQRPVGLLEMGRVAREGRSRIAVGQGNVVEGAPITVSLWPEMHGEDGALLHPRVAERNARQLAGLVYDVFRFGLDLPPLPSGRPRCGPERIPLYDYSGAATVGPAAARQGPADPHDWLWAEGYSTRAIQDPEDARRWAVICELTVTWERPGRAGPVAPVVTDMPGEFIPIGYGEVG
ncbi:MAG TPA: hypothetical protein VF192_01285 [Longimicrobiales bacterium]